DGGAAGFGSDWPAPPPPPLAGPGLLPPEDLELLSLVRSPAEARDVLVRYYRVYHSQRRVGARLVLRLHEALPDAALADLALRHADAIAAGGLRPSGPLPEEEDEPELAHLPRLVFSPRSPRPLSTAALRGAPPARRRLGAGLGSA